MLIALLLGPNRVFQIVRARLQLLDQRLIPKKRICSLFDKLRQRPGLRYPVIIEAFEHHHPLLIRDRCSLLELVLMWLNS